MSIREGMVELHIFYQGEDIAETIIVESRGNIDQLKERQHLRDYYFFPLNTEGNERSTYQTRSFVPDHWMTRLQEDRRYVVFERGW